MTTRGPRSCAPGPGNLPVADSAYLCSLGVQLQATVDSARRISHELGLRPYRVVLIWATRDARQRFQVVRELELMPVQVSPVDDLAWDLQTAGRQVNGDLILSEISPAQVSKEDLLGYLDGQPVPDGTEFWVEVTQRTVCAGDPEHEPGRYTPSGLPGLDGPGFQWVMRVTSQQNPRAAAGVADRDQTWSPARASIIRR